MEHAKDREDVIAFENLSKSRDTWKPFIATIQAPHDFPLSLHEKGIIGNHLVKAAHEICELRGLKPGEPFWIGPDNND